MPPPATPCECERIHYSLKIDADDNRFEQKLSGSINDRMAMDIVLFTTLIQHVYKLLLNLTVHNDLQIY